MNDIGVSVKYQQGLMETMAGVQHPWSSKWKGAEEVASVRRSWQAPDHKELSELVILLGNRASSKAEINSTKGILMYYGKRFLLLAVVQEEP